MWGGGGVKKKKKKRKEGVGGGGGTNTHTQAHTRTCLSLTHVCTHRDANIYISYTLFIHAHLPRHYITPIKILIINTTLFTTFPLLHTHTHTTYTHTHIPTCHLYISYIYITYTHTTKSHSRFSRFENTLLPGLKKKNDEQVVT